MVEHESFTEQTSIVVTDDIDQLKSYDCEMYEPILNETHREVGSYSYNYNRSLSSFKSDFEKLIEAHLAFLKLSLELQNSFSGKQLQKQQFELAKQLEHHIQKLTINNRVSHVDYIDGYVGCSYEDIIIEGGSSSFLECDQISLLYNDCIIDRIRDFQTSGFISTITYITAFTAIIAINILNIGSAGILTPFAVASIIWIGNIIDIDLSKDSEIRGCKTTACARILSNENITGERCTLTSVGGDDAGGKGEVFDPCEIASDD